MLVTSKYINMQDKTTKTTYKQAGVDINAGNLLVNNIKPLAKQTKRLGSDVDLGGFGGLFDLAACKFKDPLLVAANDGVGTKLKIAIEANKHDTIGIDLVAMCVNDLIVQGAEPLFFLDYFASGKLDVEIATTVIASIANGCKQAGAALIGGETAEMPGVYQAKDYDLAGFAVGAVERENLLPKAGINKDDVLIGLSSSGLHSNGYSLVRHLLEQNNIDLTSPAPFAPDQTIAEVLLTPTKIYVKPILAALKAFPEIKAMAHITGGGFTENLPRVLPTNYSAEINLDRLPKLAVLSWLQTLGQFEQAELLKTFNCGIGMVLIAEKTKAAAICDFFNEINEPAMIMGKIIHEEGLNSRIIYTGEL